MQQNTKKMLQSEENLAQRKKCRKHGNLAKVRKFNYWQKNCSLMQDQSNLDAKFTNSQQNINRFLINFAFFLNFAFTNLLILHQAAVSCQ